MAMSLFARYNNWLHVHPYTTQILTGGVLWLSGDLISQNFENNEKYDFERAAKMTFYGLTVAGPIYAWWYKVLDAKTIHILNDGKKYARWRYLGVKLFVDQIIFEVPYLALFFTISTILMNKDKEISVWTKIKQKIQAEYIYTYVTDWKVWPPIQFLNFAFVPVRYQSVVVNSICVGWNGFLSFVTNRSIDSGSNSGSGSGSGSDSGSDSGSGSGKDGIKIISEKNNDNHLNKNNDNTTYSSDQSGIVKSIMLEENKNNDHHNYHINFKSSTC